VSDPTSVPVDDGPTEVPPGDLLMPPASDPPVPTLAPSEEEGRAEPPIRMGRHLRAAVLLIGLTVLVSALIIPVVVTGFAQLVTPGTANGSLVSQNGTVVGSSLIAQNLSQPYLFWERPSLTDYNVMNGTVNSPGPTEPALGALINLTISYMRTYGNYTVNASLPLSLVSPSESNVDPDLTPEAVLVQVPRVSNQSGLSISTLTSLVEAHAQQSYGGVVGPAYVNVLELDLALLPLEGR
jgi:K+-transporting ATPase ATPase C chain